MPYVERNKQGYVIGIYAVLQQGHAEEWLDDGHPDLTAKTPEQLAAETERSAQQTLRAEAKATAMFTAIHNATLAEIDAWIDSNFPSLNVQQRALLKVLTAAAGAYLRERNGA